MPVNPDCIDLNSDAITGDRRPEVVQGINVSATETLMEPSNRQGLVEGSSVEEVIDEISDLRRDKDSAEAFRGLECVDRVADARAADVSCGDLLGSEKDRGEDEIERGSTEVKIMGGVEGDSSIDVEVLREKKNCSTLSNETVVDRLGENLSVVYEQDEKVAQAAEMFSGEVEGDRNGNHNLIEEISNPGACVSVGSNLIPEEISLIQNAVDLGSLRGVGEPNYSQVTEFFEQLPDENLGVEVKIDNTNDILPLEDRNVGLTFEGWGNQTIEVETQAEIDANQIKGVHVSEAGVSQCSGKELNMVGLVVDLNPYIINRDESEVWVRNEGTEVKDVSGVNGVGLNGNQDIVVEEQVTAIEKPKATEMKSLKSAALKLGFSVSDLVWGKVQSHPWWPGQIFDPSDSSKKAMNYFKEGSILVAYFGDGTFAWNAASRLRPFQTYFSQMEKQTDMEAFRHAVDCALDEISRRVEFGLACSCLSKELYAKIKSQIIVNAGIREESRRRDSRDEYSNAASFEPVKLVDYINALARFPYGGLDRIEHVIAQAQLLSFYRWKGYPHLPEFKMLGGLLENDAGTPVLGKKKQWNVVNKDAVSDFKDEEQVPSGQGKSNNQDSSSRKRKHSSADSMYPNKKERSLSDLMTRNRSNLLKREIQLEEKPVSKLISSSSGRKRKAIESISDDLAVKNQRSPMSIGASSKSPESKQTFRVGDSIRRVASQLNGSTPILKYGDGTSKKSKVKIEKFPKVSFGGSPYNSEKSQRRKKVIPTECPSPDEILSQLCLAAKDPMKGYNFLISVVSFFTDFRNSVCLDHPSPRKHKRSLEEKSSSKKSSKAETTETSELEYVEDSYWTDRIIESIPEEQLSLENQNETGQFVVDTPIERVMDIVESEAAPELSHNLDSREQTASGNLEVEADETVGLVNSAEELSPTALILNFTDLDSVPLETNLNKIFSRYGPLNESETEVLSKSSRAKVVFKRRSDAETAFSSAGKFSIFGPSLVSYRLKYLPSTPRKTPSPAIKRSRKDATSVESNAT